MGKSFLTGIARKHVSWRVAILLPVFLRALIPVGFMPMFAPGVGMRLVVCDSYAPLPHAAPIPMDMPADMSMHPLDNATGAHGGRPVHEDHGTCPYGSGPALGALPTLAIAPLLVQRSTPPTAAAAQVAYFEVSPRAQSPRGPPRLTPTL
jgi:hypothetical protein